MAVAHKIAHPKATRKNVTASTALRNDMRLAKLKQLKGAFTGLIGEEQSIQRMKSERTL
jgi:hypothetical protein